LTLLRRYYSEAIIAGDDRHGTYEKRGHSIS